MPRPLVGLASGGCGLWGVDDGALGDGNVDEGLDGVVLGGRLCGCGCPWGEGGSGCGGLGVLAWVSVRVWVRAGSLLLPSYFMWFLGLCGVVSVMLLLVVVVMLLLRVVLSSGFQVLIWGRALGWGPVPGWGGPHSGGVRAPVLDGGVRGVLQGSLGCLCGGWGASRSLACGSSFGFGRDFVDEVGGEGGFGGGVGGCR